MSSPSKAPSNRCLTAMFSCSSRQRSSDWDRLSAVIGDYRRANRFGPVHRPPSQQRRRAPRHPLRPFSHYSSQRRATRKTSPAECFNLYDSGSLLLFLPVLARSVAVPPAREALALGLAVARCRLRRERNRGRETGHHGRSQEGDAPHEGGDGHRVCFPRSKFVRCCSRYPWPPQNPRTEGVMGRPNSKISRKSCSTSSAFLNMFEGQPSPNLCTANDG